MLELRSLRYLVTLSRHLNYARAADELGITQPALSRSIQALEGSFGIRLFDRGRTGVTPTTAGRRLIEHATALLANADDVERRFRETANGKSGSLHFGMAPVPARALLAKSLSERLASAPDIKNDVVVRSMEALWPMLVAGQIEFVVAPTSQIPDAPFIRTESLGRFPVSLMTRPKHPLMTEARVGARYPILLSSHGFGPLSAPTDLMAEAGGAVHVIEDFDTLIEVTRNSDAVWLTSAHAVADELAEGTLGELPQRATMFTGDFEVAFISLDRHSQSPAARLMKHSLQRQLSALARSIAKKPASV